MNQLSSMSPAAFDALTKAQVKEIVFRDVRKSTAVNEYDKEDRLISQVQTITDAYDALVGTVSMGLTYYETGEVDEITIVERDPKGNTTGGHRVKHYTDGRQPELLALDGGREGAEVGLGGPGQ